MKEVDNLRLLLHFINPKTPDDFYYLQILQRKKENPQLGSNSRVIKNYYIKSPKYLEDRYEEIKDLCRRFNARAMLRLNKRSWEKVALKALVNTANTIGNKTHEFVRKCYDRACGDGHNERNARWIVDIDYWPANEELDHLMERINGCMPQYHEEPDKILAIIPTLNGLHLITKPFNVQEFRDRVGTIPDIHKDNPTNLFIPKMQ